MDSPRPDRIFRALSDPVRLRIVRVLLDGEMCVGDIVTILRVPQPTASRHLAYLRRVGLIAARKNSYWSFYALAPTRSPGGSTCLLTPEVAGQAQFLITMGCGDACPVVPGARRDDWLLEDPKGQPLDRVRVIRDEIRDRVQRLIDAEPWT